MVTCTVLIPARAAVVLALICALLAQTAPSSALRDAAKAIAAGNLEQAEALLVSVLNASPHEARALDLLGIIRAQQHRELEAEKLFQQAVQDDDHFVSAYVHLGLLYLQMSQPEEGEANLRQALQLDPARSDASAALVGALRQKARDALSSGDSEKALASLIEARKYKPEDPDVQFELGMVALRMSLLTDAISAFQQTLKFREDDANALYGLGRAYMEESKFEEASQEFAHYLQLRPNDPSAHYALGMALASLERRTEARAQFRRSIELKPEQTESYFRLGLLDLEEKDFNSASGNFDHVLKRDPRHAGALAALGKVEFLSKKYPDACALLERAVASDDSLREAHYYLGLTYARIGRKADSDQQLQIATRLEHEETEHQRTEFKILQPESETPPASQ